MAVKAAKGGILIEQQHSVNRPRTSFEHLKPLRVSTAGHLRYFSYDLQLARLTELPQLVHKVSTVSRERTNAPQAAPD
jgi:hypothetical protein